VAGWRGVVAALMAVGAGTAARAVRSVQDDETARAEAERRAGHCRRVEHVGAVRACEHRSGRRRRRGAVLGSVPCGASARASRRQGGLGGAGEVSRGERRVAASGGGVLRGGSALAPSCSARVAERGSEDWEEGEREGGKKKKKRKGERE